MSILVVSRLAAALMLTFSAPVADSDHIVQPGETLSSIAAQHNSSVGEIVEANGLSNPNLIFAGAVLRIPSDESEAISVHVVRRGETLSQIARAYGVSVAEIAEANGIQDPNRIIAGTSLAVGRAADAPIVGGETTTYVVVFGDTLSGIARRFNTTTAHLATLNDITDVNSLRSGTTLSVPGAAFICPLPGAWYHNDWHAPRPGGRIHLGTDLFAPEGTAVVAPVSGIVEQIDGTLGGKQFWLYGDDGNRYIGTHMSEFGLTGRVQAGDLVGFVGRTGNAKATDPHLHFEIDIGGVDVNPYFTLKANGC